MTPAELRNRLAEMQREAADEADDDGMIYGRVVRQTAKALLFAVAGTWNGRPQALAGGEHWLPLSQVTVIEHAVAAVDGVMVPAWLIASRANG
jgi:hypothetical protein